MAAVNPYLNFGGNCEEAFNFYKSVFGGEFLSKMRFKDVSAEQMVCLTTSSAFSGW
jgi:PhnB protein